MWKRWIPLWLGLALVPAQAAAFTVSGTVIDQGSQPVAGVELFVYFNGNSVGIQRTLTDSLGSYTIVENIFGATWDFEYVPPSSTCLLTKLIAGIEVNGDTTLNVVLDLGLVLSGTVTDTLGQPIFGIDLNAYDQATGIKLNTPGDDTDSLGFYDICLPPGLFRIRWRDVSQDKSWVAVEVENVLITGDTTINMTLLSGFIVSGTVMDSFNEPVVNADFDFMHSATGQTQFTPGDNTDLNGDYQILVPGSTYDIELAPAAGVLLVATFIQGVNILSDTTIDFIMAPGLVLSGFVRDPDMVPVVNADIDVRETLSGIKLITPGDNTDATGFYDVVIPAGIYDIAYQPVVASGLAPLELLAVNVSTDTSIDVVVPFGTTVSGQVSGPSGSPLAGIDIDAEYSVSGFKIPLQGDETDSSGLFSIVVPKDVVDLEFEPPVGMRITAKRFRNIAFAADTSITVMLDTGLVISGTVTDSTGLVPVPGVSVLAIRSAGNDTVFTPGNRTDGTGSYQLLVPPDTYRLVFRPDSASGIPDTLTLAAVPIAADTVINVSLQGEVPPAHITLDSAGMTFTAIQNTALPTSKSFVISNTGAGLLAWSAAISEAWLSVSPTSGIGNNASPQVTINTTTLAPGTYFDTIDVTSPVADNSPQKVAVSYTITEGGPVLRGDVNQTGSITSSDIIYLVAYVFKGGPVPQPDDSEGDVNCDGSVTSSDIIFLVGYVFKGGPPPLCP